MTLAAFNKKIKKPYPHVTMYRGKGYQYFIDSRDDYINDIPSLYICHLNQVTIEDVMNQLKFYLTNT